MLWHGAEYSLNIKARENPKAVGLFLAWKPVTAAGVLIGARILSEFIA